MDELRFPNDPSESPAPGQHPAPRLDARPRSPLAIWALVLSALLSAACLFAPLMWVLAVPAVLVAGWALVKIRTDIHRGYGMAITALVLSLLVASCAFLGTRVFRDMSTHLARGVLAALASRSEPSRLDAWLTEKAREDGAAARIRERYAAVVEEMGSYQDELVPESAWLGGRPYVAPPRNVEELGKGIGAPFELAANALWVRARFERGVVRLQITYTQDDPEALQQAFMGVDSAREPAVVEDVRFFRDR